MTFHYRYRKQILLGIIILLLLSGSITLIILKLPKKEQVKKDNTVVLKKKEKEEAQEEKEKEKVKIDIKGEINVPGIYEVTTNKRVMDVIELAGGLTENADTSVLNLSKKVIDEMVIIIYSREQVSHFKETKEVEKQVLEKCIQPEEDSIQNDACIETNKTSSGKVSINTGTIEELKTLSGIGDAKAKEIIAYREANGPFQTIEEIMNVPGIGEARFAAIKENITVE